MYDGRFDDEGLHIASASPQLVIQRVFWYLPRRLKVIGQADCATVILESLTRRLCAERRVEKDLVRQLERVEGTQIVPEKRAQIIRLHCTQRSPTMEATLAFVPLSCETV